MAEKSWTVSDKFWEKVEPLIPKVKRDKSISAPERRRQKTNGFQKDF